MNKKQLAGFAVGALATSLAISGTAGLPVLAVNVVAFAGGYYATKTVVELYKNAKAEREYNAAMQRLISQFPMGVQKS
jgi:hypothetical protein